MISKNELKYYSSLTQNKFRNSENKFIAEGIKLVVEGLNSDYKCEVVIFRKDFYDNNFKGFQNIFRNVKVEILNTKDFERLSELKNPQGILAVFEKKNFSSASLKSNVLIYLDDISDPGNVGTIIRTADWFGFNEIILSSITADLYNPKTLRASMGSIFHSNFIEVKNAVELKETFRDFRIYCSDLNGINVNDLKLKGKSIICFSNEANGPSSDLLNALDERITIPKIGEAESLNVASAAAIILNEISRG